MTDDFRPREERRFLAGFALVSLAAVGVGCAVAAHHGAPGSSWMRNLVAWIVGALVAWAAAMRVKRLTGFLLVAPAALAATLLNPAQEGVHRWIDVGRVHTNAAAVLLPASVVALAALRDRRWAWLSAAVMLGLLVVQPDASQAAALAAGMLAILASLSAPVLVRVGAAGIVVFAALVASIRPDPLAPVPEVEGIMKIAFDGSLFTGLFAVFALSTALFYPLRLGSSAQPSTPALALTACFCMQAVAPVFGAFPVPLVGVGMSPILGFLLGAGALAAAHRSAASAEADGGAAG